jgi:hypothetical protein
MRLRVVVAVVLLMGALSACKQPVEPSDPNAVKVNGTVRFVNLEGGFWTVRGDDNVTYDPRNGLPAAFQVEGLRVHLEARKLTDIVSIHMAGPVVEIISIVKLR